MRPTGVDVDVPRMRRTFPCYSQVLQLPQQQQSHFACECECVLNCHNLVEVALMVAQLADSQTAETKEQQKKRKK